MLQLYLSDYITREDCIIALHYYVIKVREPHRATIDVSTRFMLLVTNAELHQKHQLRVDLLDG